MVTSESCIDHVVYECFHFKRDGKREEETEREKYREKKEIQRESIFK